MIFSCSFNAFQTLYPWQRSDFLKLWTLCSTKAFLAACRCFINKKYFNIAWKGNTSNRWNSLETMVSKCEISAINRRWMTSWAWTRRFSKFSASSSAFCLTALGSSLLNSRKMSREYSSNASLNLPNYFEMCSRTFSACQMILADFLLEYRSPFDC